MEQVEDEIPFVNVLFQKTVNRVGIHNFTYKGMSKNTLMDKYQDLSVGEIYEILLLARLFLIVGDSTSRLKVNLAQINGTISYIRDQLKKEEEDTDSEDSDLEDEDQSYYLEEIVGVLNGRPEITAETKFRIISDLVGKNKKPQMKVQI